MLSLLFAQFHNISNSCATWNKPYLLMRKFQLETDFIRDPNFSGATSNKWERNCEEVKMSLFERSRFRYDDQDHVIVYIDGLCVNKGMPNAKAGFGVYFGMNNPLWVFFKFVLTFLATAKASSVDIKCKSPFLVLCNCSNRVLPVSGRATNDVAEIHAAIAAIELAMSTGWIRKLCIRSDSELLLDSVVLWMPKWKRNGWKKEKCKPIENQDDFQKLGAVIQRCYMQYEVFKNNYFWDGPLLDFFCTISWVSQWPNVSESIGRSLLLFLVRGSLHLIHTCICSGKKIMDSSIFCKRIQKSRIIQLVFLRLQ